MSLFRNVRLGLLHVAVAITFVLINGLLNRIMIHELEILASLFAAFVVLPYLLSPLQIFVGQYSDTHPLFGYRRTPYIALGLLLCIGGMLLTPHGALLLAESFWPGLLLCVVAFGLWGVGFNLAVVAYLSLASDLSQEHQRSRAIAVMWFMMITSIIITAVTVGAAIDDYNEAQMIAVFNGAGLVALGLAAIGLIGLEPRNQVLTPQSRHSQRAAVQAVINNPQARLFFIYLILLLAAILGQDILLEPFGAHEFGMTPRETTQLTAYWGSATLAALLLHGFVLSRFLDKKRGALLGGALAACGLITIALSGMLNTQALFVPGILALGFGTGIATATNLGLMLDMTTPEQAGLFIGAWGIADAIARGTGMLLGGVLRDVVTFATGSASSGYISVFLIEAMLLGGSLLLLRYINVATFREQPSLVEVVAIAGDA